MSRLILTGVIVLSLFLPIMVVPPLNDLYILPKITFLSCLLAIMLVFWAIKVRIPVSIRLFHSGFFWPVFLLLGVSVLSLVKAVNAHEGLYHVLWLFTYAMLFFLMVGNVNIEDIKRIAYWSIIGGVIVSAIGIGQFWGLNIPGLPIRLGATLGTKNMSAQHMLLVLPLSFLGFFFHQDTKKEFFYGLAGAIMAIFLVYTQSRGSWVGFIGAAVFMVLLVLRPSRFSDWRHLWQLNAKKMAVLSSCVIFFAVGISLPHFIEVPGVAEPEKFGERFESIFGAGDLSTQTRLAMWANTLDMVKDNYVLGVGAGNWKFVYPMYSRSRVIDPSFSERTQPHDAHNDWVQMAAEIGVGFLAFLWIILIAYRTGWRVLARSVANPLPDDRYARLTVLFSLFGLSGVLISAFFDFPFEHPVPFFYFWVLLSFIAIAANSHPGLQKKNRDRGKRFLPLLLLLVSFFVVFYAGLNLFLVKGSYHFWQGMVLFKNGRLAESAIEVKKATSLDPTNFRYHTALSRIYVDEEDYSKMAVAAKMALVYHPQYCNAWNNLGVAFSRVGLSAEAAEAFGEAVRIYPGYFHAHMNLADLYVCMGEREKAKKEYKTALSIRPDSQKALNKLRSLCLSK